MKRLVCDVTASLETASLNTCENSGIHKQRATCHIVRSAIGRDRNG